MPRRPRHDAQNSEGKDAHSSQNSGRSITIDGIEGEYARVELPDGTIEDRKLDHLPEGAKEGDVLRETDAGLQIDHEETHARKKKAQAELDKVNGTSVESREIDL